jgi:hypothetical protein
VNIGIFLKIEDCEGGVILYAGSSCIRVNLVIASPFSAVAAEKSLNIIHSNQQMF